MEPTNLLLCGTVGSTAYGLATPESDIDRLGVFQARTSTLLGLHKPKESIVSTGPDETIHELGKFIKLCLANNPTVMELLWLDEYDVITPLGQNLIDQREMFLSQRCRATYGGYARQQYKRLLDRGDGSFSADTRKRTEKHARHCYRLILQGANILREGKLRVRLTSEQVQMCREAGLMAANDVVEFGKAAEIAMADFDATPTSLPEHPDTEAAESLLVTARLADLSTHRA